MKETGIKNVFKKSYQYSTREHGKFGLLKELIRFSLTLPQLKQ